MFYIRSVVSVTKRFLKKEVFKYKAIHPLGEAFAPLTPNFVNREHMTFGRRNLVEQVFRSLKLRL